MGKGGNSLIGSLRAWRIVQAQHVASSMKIVDDVVDLERIEPVAHSAIQVRLGATVFELREPPFATDLRAWKHPADYGATQAFARVAREARIGATVYPSARDPEPARCIAVLDPAPFASPRPDPAKQTA